MPTPTSPDPGADLTNQFISDKYTSLLHLSGAQMTSPLAEDQSAHGVYDGKGNYTGIGVTTTSISFNNITMPKSTTDTTLVDYFFPIGSIFISLDNVNPGVRMTETVWELVSTGLFLAGVGTGTDRNDTSAAITAGDTNRGEYTHTLTVEEMPSHYHDVHGGQMRVGRTNGTDKEVAGTDTTRALRADTTFTGGGQAHNNIPPSYGVYVWKRTS